jgi:DNA-binding transcriptional regulator LsrR (DeoR family)
MGKGLTLKEISDKMGLSYRRVRRIIEKLEGGQ